MQYVQISKQSWKVSRRTQESVLLIGVDNLNLRWTIMTRYILWILGPELVPVGDGMSLGYHAAIGENHELA